jgi:CRISPR-associated protein Cmr4
LTPLQPGTGRGLGVVDLPIAREVATGLPYLPGSSFKGVLRDRCGKNGDSIKLFGPETDNASDHAGMVQFTDMRLLLLPVRSLAGTFAWVTSPFVLRRFARDCQMAGLMPPTVPTISDIEKTAATTNSALFIKQNEVVLEDLLLKQETVANLSGDKGWASFLADQLFPNDTGWQETLKTHLCLVHDDALSFLLETATEVVARIRLQDDSKTVAKGGLWYEEMLPAETILTGLAVAQQVQKTGLTPTAALTKVGNLLTPPIFQFGGNATVGRGLCRLVMAA